MTKKKKIYLILAILSLLLCIYTTSSTYAKYFTQNPQEKAYNIKKWIFKINNDIIKNNEELNEEINVETNLNTHVAKDKIAPDSSGKFTIALDYTNVDLSFYYELQIEESDKIKDLTIEKIEVDGTEQIAIDNKVTSEVTIDETTSEKTKEIIVYVKWNDDAESSMNNKEDTDVTINNESVNFNLNIKLTQKE